MDKNQILENIRLKAELKYELMYESAYYKSLDKETTDFLKDNYDKGVKIGLEILKSPGFTSEELKELDEEMDEGFLDRVRATGARALQGVKNITGLGTQTADSKDAAVNSLFKGFKRRFDQTPGGAAPVSKPVPAQQQSPEQAAQSKETEEKLKKQVADEVEEIEAKTKNLPPIDTNQAVALIDKSTSTPPSLKQRLKNAIINNPTKARLIVGGLALAAGALGTLAGVPPMVTGAIVNGIGNAVINKAEGKSPLVGFAIGAATGVAVGGAGGMIASAIPTIATLGGIAAAKAAVAGGGVAAVSAGSIGATYAGVTGLTAAGTVAGSALYNKYANDDLARGKSPKKENLNKNLFNKIGKNTFKMETNIIKEALSGEQNAIIQDFLKDLGKTLNQSPEGVVQFMKSQGDRFKHILDYLPSDVGGNRSLTPGAGGDQEQQPGQQPGQPGQPGVPGQPGQIAAANPKITKNLNAIKASPLFSGDLATRIASVVDVKSDDEKAMQALKVFLKSVNGIISTQSANAKKQLGDPAAILGTLKEADIKGFSDLSKQIVGVMPSILGLAFELRQAFSNKNPNAVKPAAPTQPGGAPAQPGGANPAAPTQPQPPKLSEAEGGGGLDQKQIGVIKAFLSQLVNVGIAVKNTDPAQADAVKLKNLFRTILTLANLITSKNTAGIKINPKIDKAFQGKDLVGPSGGDKKPAQVKKGPGDIFKENRYKLQDYKKFF